MSEYQYYEFRAIDRPLDRSAQEALRSISSRARITARSFINHYEWGDFKGDPRELVEQWFDLHLYFANWGSRRLIMRLPARLLDREMLEPFLVEADWAEVSASGDNLIIDIFLDEVEPQDDLDDGSEWLAQLAPLRGDVLCGDLRLFYLLWLKAVQDEVIVSQDVEPLPGVGPLTDPLGAFAAFFGLDPDLLQAAAEREYAAALSPEDRYETLAALSDGEKTKFLRRFDAGDPHVRAELRRRVRGKPPPSTTGRTAENLRNRAREIAQARERADAERRAAAARAQAQLAAKARRARLMALRRRGSDVWREVEEEIERRNASGYDRAAALLRDLRALAMEDGEGDRFDRRLVSIRTRHEKKQKFIDRLTAIEQESEEDG